MNKTLITTAIIAALSLLQATTVEAAGWGRRGFVRPNAAGGYSGGSGSAFRGPNGAGAAGRGFATDGQGNAVAGSGRMFRTPGGVAGRAGLTTHSADGTTTHQGAFGASGVNGSAWSQGNSSYNPQTGLNANRQTSAQATTGQSYTGNTAYSQGTGVTHSGICTNAAGQAVACPQR